MKYTPKGDICGFDGLRCIAENGCTDTCLKRERDKKDTAARQRRQIDRNVVVEDYWWNNYMHRGLCCLCGNSGIIDTRLTAISAAGVNSGKLSWCICPNGQILRMGANADPSDEEHYVRQK